uniref:VQ domain-containing protein n=1 Tax=Leersia perrieri TaxID=77586 RepID=A0A0D9VDN8_9ORYZ
MEGKHGGHGGVGAHRRFGGRAAARCSTGEARGGSRPELQGPRPAPLKVSKDSHKIRKQQQQVQQVRQPVIIYTMSPKVVHANAAEFMSVVQRLTGAPRAVTTPPVND